MRQEAAEREQVNDAAEPFRRCALTRATRPKDELLRFVLGPDGTVVPDLKEKLPGRGVWLTAARDSVAEAVKRKVFGRSLKAEAKAPEGLADRIDRLLADAALGALGLTNKAGEVVFGAARVEEAIGKGRVLALIHASEAADDGRRKLDGKFRGMGGNAGSGGSHLHHGRIGFGIGPDKCDTCCPNPGRSGSQISRGSLALRALPQR